MKRRPLWPFGSDTRICVSLDGPNTAALREQFDHLEGADLVEIRLDALDTLHDLTREASSSWTEHFGLLGRTRPGSKRAQ